MPVFNHRRIGGLIMILGVCAPATTLTVTRIGLILLKQPDRIAVVQLLTSKVPHIAVSPGYSVI